MTELTVDLKNYPEGGSVFHRTAARAIVQRDGSCLLVYTKNGDHKFPGGGAEPGESLEDALIREVREETGYRVRKSSIRKWGVVHELRSGTTADILSMDSHYFCCEVEPDPGEQELDGYEAEENYQACWRPLEKALEANRKLLGLAACPWVARELKVMEALLKERAVLTSRRTVVEFCKSLGDVWEDSPFHDDNWTVLRHRRNKKGFAFLYEYRGQLQVNVKCSPEWTAFWRGAFDAVLPGYHMNKTHWNTIVLNGTVPDRDVQSMIGESYRLTAPAEGARNHEK